MQVIDPRRPLAIIIGITNYVEPRLRLASPVRDAEALAMLLEQQHGYEIRLVRDQEASKVALQHLLDIELPVLVDEARPLLLYFAGHGTAIDSIDEPRGYFIPVDGGNDLDSLLPMEKVASSLSKLPSRHLLLVLDCCFAGAFRWSSSRDIATEMPPIMYRERHDRFLATPAWQVITSAAYDEQAADVISGRAIGKRESDDGMHSPFFNVLLQGLRGHADISPRRADGLVGDGVITATELYLYLRHEMETTSDRQQTPGLWMLPKHRKGEYIFYVPSATLALPDAPTLSIETSPYRGFLAYEEEHVDLFHGRRAATEALRQQVERQPITIVIGSSGTGKSSLVRAGLLPALRKAHPDWQILSPIRPGPTPLETLEAALASECALCITVLAIDQLEELFSIPDRSAEWGLFLARLMEATASGNLRIVGTLRADLETEFWSSPLADTWERVRFPLGDMTQDELREAIEAPAEQKVLTFEPPEMVDRLINTVVSMPGALPLLSFTLHKLYVDCLARATNDRKLIETTEGGAGGISLALREHTDRIYASFDDATRDTMRRVLLRMVTVKAGSIVRRALPLAELKFTDPQECARVQVVLDALTGRTSEHAWTPSDAVGYGMRLAVRGGTKEGGFVELAHDAVVREWPQFHAWLRDASEEKLLLQQAVTVSAMQWVLKGKHPGYLWRDDPRLPQALHQLLAVPYELNQSETAFVACSRVARRRRRQVALGGLVAFVLVVLALAFVAYRRANESRRFLASSYQETARNLLIDDGRPLQSIPYLFEVMRIGEGNSSLRMLFHSATRNLPISPPLAHRDIVWNARFSPNGMRVVTASGDHAARVWDATTGKAITPPLMHRDSVHSAVFSPDGMRVVTASSDHTARIWDAATGNLLAPPLAHPSEVAHAAFSPDGRRIVTVGRDGTARIWDAATGKPVTPPLVHRGEVSTATFSPDSTRVITASWDKTACIWDAATGKPLGSPFRHEDSVNDASFSPDGTRVVTVSDDHTARIWDALTGKLLIPPLTHQDRVSDAEFSRDGKRLVTASWDHTACIWDAATGRPLAPLLVHQDLVNSAAFSPDGTRIVTMSNNTVGIWDATTGKLLTSPLELQDSVESVEFSPDGARVVIASQDNIARVWDARTDKLPTSPIVHQGIVQSAVFSPDGHEIATASDDNTARVWDASTGRPITSPLVHEAIVRSVVFSPDSAKVLTASGDHTAVIWSVDTGKPLVSPLTHEGQVFHAWFSPDGTRAVTASGDNTARVWDAFTGKPITPALTHGGIVWNATFSPDGMRVITASGDNTARIWDATTGKALVLPLVHQDNVLTAVFSPDGARVATASWDKSARVWDATTGKPITQPLVHHRSVCCVAFSPDGTRVVTGSADKSARVWDAITGRALTPPFMHQGGIETVAFSSDGMRVLTASSDKTARIWDAATGQPLTRPLTHEGAVMSAVFSPDGARIVTASDDKTAYVWDTSIDEGTLTEWEAIAERGPYVLVNGALSVGVAKSTTTSMP